MKYLARLACYAFGHTWTSWQLVTAYFGREITKDATVRRCSCCHASQSQVIPFRRFNLAASK